MHIITVIMLQRETAPPWWEDLNLGLPGKGTIGWVDSQLLGAGSSGEHICPPQPCFRDMGYFGLQLRDEPKVSSQKSWNKKESDLGIG